MEEVIACGSVMVGTITCWNDAFWGNCFVKSSYLIHLHSLFTK